METLSVLYSNENSVRYRVCNLQLQFRQPCRVCVFHEHFMYDRSTGVVLVDRINSHEAIVQPVAALGPNYIVHTGELLAVRGGKVNHW